MIAEALPPELVQLVRRLAQESPRDNCGGGRWREYQRARSAIDVATDDPETRQLAVRLYTDLVKL